MLLGSCEKPLDFDPGEVSPYVVVISRPVNDSLMSVFVGYSRFFLDNRAYNTVTDATVTVTDGAGTYAGTYEPNCFVLNNGYMVYDDDGEYWSDSTFYGGYTFTLRPQPGDTLRLQASVPGYDKMVSATTTIPQQPEVEVLEFVIDTGKGSYYDEYGGYYSNDSRYYKIRFKVKCQNPDEFFSVKVQNSEYRRIHPTQNIYGWDTNYWENNYFTVNDPLVNSSSIEDVIDGYDGSFNGEEMFFSSELFQNGEHEFTAIFSKWPTGSADYDYMAVRIEVKSLTRELYRYEQTSKSAEYDSFDGLFSEPVQVICNIKGGIGVFGGASSKNYRMPEATYGTFQHNDGYYYKKGRK